MNKGVLVLSLGLSISLISGCGDSQEEALEQSGLSSGVEIRIANLEGSELVELLPPFEMLLPEAELDEAEVVQVESLEGAQEVAAVTSVDAILQPESNLCAIESTNLTYLCGPENAEDALRIGNSEWLLVSGMNAELTGNGINGKIHLVNHIDKTYQVLFPGTNPVLEQDMTMFSQCPGPLDVNDFSAHGLALQRMEDTTQQYRLYMTSHGAREAIEVFDIDASSKPTIKWVGCVPMPSTSWTNSVTILQDQGFFATQFMDPTGSGMAGVNAGGITGHVFEWHPGESVSILAGTELSGPNGIAMSDNERYLYVSAFGSQQVVRFDRDSTPVSKNVVDIAIAPDNIRWTTDGTLYAAGGNTTEQCPGPDCGIGWSVIEIDPLSLETKRITGADETAVMQGVSSALLVDDEIWIGTYNGDRVGILLKP